MGALLLSQGTWAVPDVPSVADGIVRAGELAVRGDGEMLVLPTDGGPSGDTARLQELFTAQREDEWVEFISDCAKFEAEIDKEIRIEKFTFAELEEEEQSLDRLRRWHKTVKARDVFSAPSAERAEKVLKACTHRLEGYTELVFKAQHGL